VSLVTGQNLAIDNGFDGVHGAIWAFASLFHSVGRKACRAIMNMTKDGFFWLNVNNIIFQRIHLPDKLCCESVKHYLCGWAVREMRANNHKFICASCNVPPINREG